MKAKIHARILSAILFTALIPLAHAQSAGDLVFTEISNSQMSETLNGVSIGNWQYTGTSGDFIDLDNQNGGLYGPGEVVFLDPLNPGADSLFDTGQFDENRDPSTVYPGVLDPFPTTQSAVSSSYTYGQLGGAGDCERSSRPG